MVFVTHRSALRPAPLGADTPNWQGSGNDRRMRMQGGTITVVRALRFDASLLSAVLLRLRRDSVSREIGWTLGERGAVEIDVHFTPAPSEPGVYGPAWVTKGQLWDPAHLACAPIEVLVHARAADACELVLTPGRRLGPWWDRHQAELETLAIAAAEELAEELLWHATRGDIARIDA